MLLVCASQLLKAQLLQTRVCRGRARARVLWTSEVCSPRYLTFSCSLALSLFFFLPVYDIFSIIKSDVNDCFRAVVDHFNGKLPFCIMLRLLSPKKKKKTIEEYFCMLLN